MTHLEKTPVPQAYRVTDRHYEVSDGRLAIKGRDRWFLLDPNANKIAEHAELTTLMWQRGIAFVS